MLRITAIGAGAVDYLLRGCEAHEHLHELEARADAAELGADRYFAQAMELGEPAGVWLGHGWDALELGDIQVGAEAREDEVRAVFGQLRRPDSTERDPVYIGSRPHTFVSYEERLDKLRAAEPEATPERERAMEREARAGGTRNVAYYDFTFSPVKSVSVLYAAYLGAGDEHSAAAVRAAHDDAVKIALAYAEAHVAFTRRGGDTGRTYVQGEGLAAVAFGHHTSREHEPQLHTHLAVLNRLGADGKITALDGKGFRAFKEAIATAYERAVEQKVTEATGLRFELRPDGVAREVAGMDPDLLAEASTRRGQVTQRVRELVAQHRERTGHEPSAAARKAMAQEATLSTRAAKSGLAGPRAVAAWAGTGHDRRGRLAASVAEAGRLAALAGAPVPAGPERIEAAMAAGLADVQARYSTWQIGNLVDAIDRHLGDAAALGVPAEARAATLEALARRVLDPEGGFGVVQLSAHEQVPVPAALCRADGRPVWRPHEERRFATVEHLGIEADVASTAAAGGARVPERAVLPLLEAAGLSADQEAAVLGIMRSGRHGDVLIGPAGTGKSRTVGALAHAWTETVGGTVYGVATAQVATSNLAGDGLTALNTTRFLAAVTPDPVSGVARRPLRGEDLVVLDEASMTSVRHISAITAAAARVGAKVVYTGDPHQLGAVETGGLFAHLADTLPVEQVHHLAVPHRFSAGWEAEASLALREGDQAVVDAYNDRGRLHAGTIEEMAAAARRGWLADRLAGLDAVLVVGSNTTAADTAAELQEELRELGRVHRESIADLADGNRLSLGDVVETRRNAWSLRVDPGSDGVGEAVMNRGRYTIIGRGQDGVILGRDRHGAVAHLPTAYLAEHAALGYASTVHAAEGVTADAGHQVVDRDATREAVYVGATRGRAHNFLYLVTEREPDAHEPQRIGEVAAERLAAVLEVTGAERSAAAVAAADQLERRSAPVLLERLDAAARAATAPHLTRVRDRLGLALNSHDYDTTRLAAALRAVEYAGHDAGVVLEQVLDARGFDNADNPAAVLAHRLRGRLLADTPDPAMSWTDRLAVRGDPELHDYTRGLADHVAARQAELADQLARQRTTEAPAWAATLGPRPDLEVDPDGERDWRHRAGTVAFYREAAGLDADQTSLGAAPSRERPLERAAYEAALAATPRPVDEPPGRWDARAADDADLYAARERWDRDFAQAPEHVSEQMMHTNRYARGYREDAAIETARAEAMPAGPARDEVAADAARSARFAEQHEARAVELEDIARERAAWWERSEPVRLDAAAAAAELDRRGLPAERVPDDPTPPELDQAAPGEVVDSGRALDEPAPEPEPKVFAQQREARVAELEQAGQQQAERAAEQAAQQQPDRKPSRWRTLDEEMLLDDEIRGHAQALARERSPEHTLSRDLDDGPELGW